MADPYAQDEAIWKCLAERPGTVGHRHRIAGVNVGNAGRDGDVVGALRSSAA
jgi:hypothetical protein